MGIDVLISALAANFLTGLTKPDSELAFTAEQIALRKTVVRIMNAGFALFALVATSWIMNEPVSVTEVSGAVELLVNLVVTFFIGQGGYALIKDYFSA